MFWKWTRLILLLVICSVIYFVGHFGIPFLQNPIPPMGKLVNPYTGFWQNDDNADQVPEMIEHADLKSEVTVLWDKRLVPHIFADNNHDLYFTQGYITASHRLWQMDFLSRVSGGRLSEVVGSRAKEFDLFHRRIGLLESAKKVIDTLQHYPEEYAAVENYTKGVNAYIADLQQKNFPIEFKLMNYHPEEWTVLKTALILKYMAWDLDGTVSDRYITESSKVFSDSLFQELYPSINPYYEPIVPSRASVENPQQQRTIRRNSSSRIPSNEYSSVPTSDKFLPSFLTNIDNDYQKGSNNWVISGAKSRSGNPILANDPHLSMSLPSLWYETQLVSDDVNVYGVSLPGVPMIVIGFNENIAWGFTYTTSDPIDFTKIEWNEEGDQYKMDGQWINPRIRQDTIKVTGGENLITSTMITEAGPVIYKDSIPRFGFNSMIPGANIAMNWTAHQPTLEFLTMFQMNRAANYNDYKAALPYFSAPGQNFVFASNEGDIAIWHNGDFPVRDEAEGRFVNDTLRSDGLWKEMIPFEQLPNTKNPEENFISSANASPVKENYAYYLGVDDYATFERTNRIVEVLDSLQSIIPFDFQKLQLDNYSLLAEKLLPVLLTRLPQQQLSDNEKDVYSELAAWDYEFDADAKSASVFNAWIWELRRAIWKDEVDDEDLAWMMPRIDVTAQFVLTDSTLVQYDNRNTEKVESLNDIILASYQTAISDLVENYGSLNDAWQWGNVNPTRIASLANLDGFGSANLQTGGSKRSVNAISGTHGPSWRMIVELGEEPTAYGVYPGGQSGNPGSAYYDSFVDDWASGNYYELKFLKNKEQQNGIIATTTVKQSEE